MKKLSLMILLIFSVSGFAQASLGSIESETTRFKEMVDRVSEQMSVEEAERFLEEKEIISEDVRYSLEREAATLAAKLVLERSSQYFNILCPCGQTCEDGQLGFFCKWGYSCNGFGVCEKVNPRGGG